MKIPTALSAVLCLFAVHTSLCAAIPMAPETPAFTNPAEQLIHDYSKAYKELGLGGEMELSYFKQIQNLLSGTDVARQRQVFNQLEKQLAALSVTDTNRNTDKKATTTKDKNFCQNLQLRQIAFEVELNQQKLSLIETYLGLGKQAVLSEQGLASSTMGKQWYAYLRKAWLTMDTTPEALMALGETELNQALTRYRHLQARIGYAGRDTEFANYLNSEAFLYPEGSTPLADYTARQAIIYQNLTKLFVPTSIQAPQIRQSTLGSAFPVDGYYEPDEGSFYFNKAKTHYERRNIDWLLLHESTPGHHFQNRYAQEQRGCPDALPHSFYSAFAEGWGAYVEEFGSELGLFQTDADALGAVEWDLVRSIRVVLDVGINYYGWSEQQAKDFWQSKLPMLPALAQREITRVRNWPVQAITYKQGSVLLRQLRSKEQLRQGKEFDIRIFHDNVLKNGAIPLQVLSEVLPATTSKSRHQ